jgi:hypothetical protein
MIHWMIRLVLMGTCCLLAQSAFAATRNVCFNRVVVDDTRVDCPAHNAAGGNIRNRCGASDSERAPVGFRVQLWDADATAAQDDLIGTWVLTGLSNCFTFEWEGSAFFEGETDGPDAYLVFLNSARQSGGTGWITTARSGTGAALADIAVRDIRSNNCATNGTGCTVASEVKPATGGTNAALRQQILLTAQYEIQLFNDRLDRNIDIWFPETTCTTGCTISRSQINMPSTLATNGSTLSHEFGHVWQEVEFGQDTLVDDCSANGAGWSLVAALEQFENQSCATTEGFASYVAALLWYDPNGTTSPVAPLVWAQDLETATLRDSDCEDNRWLAKQVAKAFWDLDDLTNELGVGEALGNDDLTGQTTASMVDVWDLFPNGTANRQDEESDINGVNARDYKSNATYSDASSQWESFGLHNCLQDQDDN